MIRRQMWAAATCALALAGAARAQTGSAPKATLGQPRPEYTARGAAPTPGYPTAIPRPYAVPTPPTYAAPAFVPVASGGQDPSKIGPAPRPVDDPRPQDAPKADPPRILNPPAPAGGGTGGFAADQAPATPAPVVTAPAVTGPAVTGPVVTGPAACGPVGDPFAGTFIGYTPAPLPNAWVSAELLYWRLKGITVPPLVTVAPAGSPGTLDDALTTVVYGGPDIADDWESGYRVRGGVWFDTGSDGLDFAFFSVGNVRDTFALASDGAPGVFRPFYNTAINAEDAQIVAFVDPVAGPLLAGRVAVVSDTDLSGMELNYRTGFTSGLGGRFDLLCGYRYLRLKDTLAIMSESTTLVAIGAAPAGTTVFVADRFEALSQFHGAQVGVAAEWQIGCMTFGFRGTVAAGVTYQDVEVTGVSGSTTPAGAVVSAAGGLLALPTNIGDHERSRFSVAPEVGATVGYQCTDNLRVFGGYNLLCWTNVVRSGEQINRFINGTAIPDPTTGTAAPIGAPSPRFRYRDDTLYVHGLSLGVEFRY